MARPLVALVAQYAARFSRRALEVHVDSTVLGSAPAWPGRRGAARVRSTFAVGPTRPVRLGLMAGSVPITDANESPVAHLRDHADCLLLSVLLARADAAAMLVSLQTANTGYDMRHVLAFDIPPSATGGPSVPRR